MNFSWKKLRRDIWNYVIGVWIISLLAVLLIAVLQTLGGYRVLEVAEAVAESATDNHVTTTSIVLDAAELAERIDRVSTAEDQYADISEAVKRLEDSLATDEITNGDGYYWGQLDPIVTQAGIDSLALIDPEDYRNVQGDVELALSGNHQLIQDFQALLSQFEASREESTVSSRYTELLRLYDQRDVASQAVGSAQNDVAAFLLNKPEGLSAVMMEIKSIRQLFGGYFFTASQTTLVIVLAMVMGALGSMMHITRSYLAGDRERQPMWYLIRPLLGVIAALAIFILAKAGQLAILPDQSEEGLSPWFISFLAIASGLLSDAAIERIRQSGQGWLFTGQAGTSRWGVNLEGLLGESGQSLGDMAGGLRIEETLLSEWVGGSQAVPQREQEIIAAWLRKPVREIFSDIAPGT